MEPPLMILGIRVYPILCVLSIVLLIYFNFGDQIKMPIFWQEKMSFVGTNGTRFVLKDNLGGGGGESMYVNGWNSYWLMEESAWEHSRFRVKKMMRKGAKMGMTVCRTWAFSDGDRPNSLQVLPGVYKEKVFEGLDFVIVEARKNRIRLILSLVNNLDAFGGKSQYVKWAKQVGVNATADSFFSDPIIKSYYKNYVKTIVTRKNSLSGVRYSEEPAIFAWELINEPRCTSSSCAPILQAWIVEMAAYMKSLDKKHLVTVGLEGFYGSKTTKRSSVNPGKWAASLGSDFIENSAVDNIDFASVHAYPDSWIPDADVDEKAKYLSNWVDAHVNDSENILKKPVLFTEVGSSSRAKKPKLYDRDLYLKLIYDKIYESAKRKEAGAGALVWQLLVEGLGGFVDPFSFVAWDHPSTYNLIVQQSCRLRSLLSKNQSDRKLVQFDPC